MTEKKKNSIALTGGERRTDRPDGQTHGGTKEDCDPKAWS